MGIRVPPPRGTMYVWVPVPAGHTSVSFTELVLEQAGVVVSPGSSYGPNGEGYVRLSLTLSAGTTCGRLRRSERAHGRTTSRRRCNR